MPNAQPLPWAILLCRYSDDKNNPGATTIKNLAAQWRAQKGAQFAADNLNASWDTDNRTILQLYESFFTPAGANTFNAVRYWDEMSHGSITVAGSKVFPCVLNRTSAQAAALAVNPGGGAYQNDTFALAKKALKAQFGADWHAFPGGVAVSFQSPDFGAQGGWYDGGPGVFMDIRYVKNNGIEAWGQEMGHGFGMDHSRTDGEVDAQGVGIDYTDPWDIMSTANALSAPDQTFGQRGPGVNAWNMRGRQWLDETRVFKPAPGDFSDLAVDIRPLHKRQLNGWLAAELPGINGESAYLAELRAPNDWDAGIGKPVVIIRRFEGPIKQFLGTHSYVMKGTQGEKALSAGDSFVAGGNILCKVSVAAIDPAGASAKLLLSRIQGGGHAQLYHAWQGVPNGNWSGVAPMVGFARQVVAARNADGRLEIFYVGTNNVLYHNWQVAPNGQWHGEAPLGGLATLIAIARNADGRLEIFYVGTNRALYHNAQQVANGAWVGEQQFAGASKQVAVGINKDGRLEVFYTGLDDSVHHKWQTAPGAGWSQEGDFAGTKALQMAVGTNQDGRLELFYVGTNGALYHAWQTAPGSARWSGENKFANASAKQVAVGANRDGRLEIFYIGTDQGLYHNAQAVPNGAWLGESRFAGDAGHQVAVGQNADGRLEAFYVGTDGTLYHNWQTPLGNAWHGEASFGLKATQVAVAANKDGRLEWFAIGT